MLRIYKYACDISIITIVVHKKYIPAIYFSHKNIFFFIN